MSSLFCLLLACASRSTLDSAIDSESSTLIESDEEISTKSAIPSYSIALIEEYEVDFVYESLPNRVFAAGNNINLRSKPRAGSAIVSKIPLAHEIELLTPIKEQTIGSKTDHWYHVRTNIKGKTVEGYLFGSTMTPHRLTTDWDDDGHEEHMIAVFNDKKELLLRIADGNHQNNVWSNMGAYVQDEHTATSVTIKLFPKEVAGLPLLKLEVENHNQTFFWSKFVSYKNENLYRALEYTESESDAAYSSINPDFGRKRLTLKEIQGVVQADGSEKQVVVSKGYVLQGGIYIEKTTSEPETKIIPPVGVIALEDAETQ
ncbi:MAG: SH3 domain-containing protein [Myxococcota bacterium]|nr:SH3 domain-containing protein [Myxococcota bacterium]